MKPPDWKDRGHHLLSAREVMDGDRRLRECVHCGKLTTKIYSHVREKHADIVTECPFCWELLRFSKRTGIRCPSCGSAFSLDKDFRFPGVPNKCPFCRRLVLVNDGGPVGCPHCEGVFPATDRLRVDIAALNAAHEAEGRVFSDESGDAQAEYARLHGGVPATEDEPDKPVEGPPTDLPVHRLAFELLAPGRWDVEDVLRHYREVQQRLPKELRDQNPEWRRIREIQRLGPNECYVGTKMWNGYAVYTFDHTQSVVLECPFRGNAIYILDSDWRNAVRKTKQEVRDQYDPVKIVHKGDWLDRLRAALKSPAKRRRRERT